MSSRAALQRRVDRLREIGGILSALESFAVVETHRLGRALARGRAALAAVEGAALELLSYAAVELPPSGPPALVVAIGSQRGFCGPFDRLVQSALEAVLRDAPGARIVVVGRRLAERLSPLVPIAATLDGPLDSEEIAAVTDRLLEALARGAVGPSAIGLLAWSEEGGPRLRSLLPSPASDRPPADRPPVMHLPPARLLARILDELVPLRLETTLTASLLVENQERMRRMRAALDRLEERLGRLRRQSGALRRARIVEEIELLLTSAETMAGATARR